MPPAAASGHPGSQHAGYPSYPPSRHGHEGEEEQRARRYAPPSNGPDAPSENHGTSQQLPSTNADAGTVQSRPIVSSGSRASMDEHRPVKIKIAQQPLHARMCGFGEKDRRPVDPPPIVQLIFEDEETADGTSPNPASHNGQQKSKEDHPQNEPIKTEGEAMEIKATTQQSSGEGDEHASKESEHAEDHRDDHDHDDDGHDDDDHAYDHSPAGAVGGADAKAPGQDHLYVLHVSLWSQDGSEVRNMIATPTAGSAGISSAGDGSNSGSGGVSGGGGGGGGVVMEPPKLTRILMGSLVISPVLLNNAEGKPGWYFSFPDLSIRTEGVYTLKFSLMRFGSENGHASTLVTEVVSNPFTVYSAKKFPGMTESTELSKAFAKQGLKIPIRNDLRVKKADRD
ncbi:hypothetical protein BGW38_008086 [Lunasporangiospora selenospora]|uniref:Velvet domain-containing protein n=1 Tax=Lunasporangiospora selenospora TaxID=979761 RepID=A0A9P6FY69_9FUNG|nr:hypothetical protein BGW38_008086 [Lunasporangiospora selenospora]